MAFVAAAAPAFRSAIALNAAPRNNGVSRVSAACPRRGSSVAARATPMPGLPTSGLKDLGNCVKAAQFDRAMLSELFVIADAMSEVRPGSPESTMLQHDDVAVPLHGADRVLQRFALRGAGVLARGLRG